MTSGRMFLITSEERKNIRGKQLPPDKVIVYLLDLFLSSLHYNNILSYILINNKSGILKDHEITIRGSLEARHFDYVMPNYIWFICKNNSEIRPKPQKRIKIK